GNRRGVPGHREHASSQCAAAWIAQGLRPAVRISRLIMGVYDSQVALAERLIREQGKAIQVVRQTTVTTPGKPWEPGVPGEALTDAYGVFLNFSQSDMETMSKMAGASEIQASDRKVLLAAA